jgi:hypothetical protein
VIFVIVVPVIVKDDDYDDKVRKQQHEECVDDELHIVGCEQSHFVKSSEK